MDVKTLLDKMTVLEKAQLLCGASSFSMREFKELGIPRLNFLDGGTGINFEQLFPDRYQAILDEYRPEEADNVIRYFYEEDKLTDKEKELRGRIADELGKVKGSITAAPGCYPPGIFLGATWNPETVYNTGKALGIEALCYGVGVLLGTPNVNILREPRNGRLFEGYSEDPALAAGLAPEICRGVEESGVASNTKHFVCNNLEKNRVGIEETVSMRALREIYFPGFKACSKVTKTFMSAYPSINGTLSSENKFLLTDVLRDEWGFDGAVVTDWGACTGKTSDAIKAGCDIYMPGPWKWDEVMEALESGALTAEQLDKAVVRVLDLVDKHASLKIPEDLTDETYIAMGDKAAYEAAAEGIVMLINKDKAMPVSQGSKITILGSNKGKIKDFGGGSAQVFTTRTSSLPGTLEDILGSASISYGDMDAFDGGAYALIVETIESREGSDREDLKMTKQTREILNELIARRRNGAVGKIVLVLNVPGPVELGSYKDEIDGLYAVFYPGMKGAEALAEIITGRINPSGALPVTFPERYEDTPAYLCYPDSFKCVYGEGIYVGYRGYQARGIRPLFPFGFGLTYTDFEIEDADCTVNGGKVTVKARVSNTGDMDGKVILQAYSHKVSSGIRRPVMELRAFTKEFIGKGETRDISFGFDVSSLMYFDEDHGKFLLEDGKYEIRIGTSCEDIAKTCVIDIEECSEELKFGPDTSCDEINRAPDVLEALKADVAFRGLSFQPFITCLRYTPQDKVKVHFPECDRFENFMTACAKHRRD
ncbi:MAG: glycoside hydrolase family 3 C-terminal domain-containing protein [Saccharofermentans sp.]|nr:glycoside hydrolase family 3 C-terminal domain-containing protein [Saccharofermentans sp.]